jgi:thioesterase domain-containing protein
MESRPVTESDPRLRQLCSKLASMPPVAAMGLAPKHWRDGRLQLSAPLAANVNDKGCAFGGSLASLMTLSAWGLVTLELAAAGIDDAEVYVQDSQLQYLAPLYDDLVADAWLAGEDVGWDAFVDAYRSRGRARAVLAAEVRRGDGVVAASLSGRFVALRPKASSRLQRWQRGHHTLARWPIDIPRSALPHCRQGSPSRPYTCNSCSK